MGLAWFGFIALVIALLALDLGVFNRDPHVVTTGEALGWTAFWIALALVFNGLIYAMYENHWLGIGLEIGHSLGGREAALQFFTAYVIEKSLSLDNIFVIAMIFAYFQVPAKYQHRVLFWGIVGALLLRGIMIAAGLALIERFAWLTYFFGALLLFTAIKMMVTRHDSLEPDRNPLVGLMRRLYPVTEDFREHHFLVREGGRTKATPLLLALVIVESTDVLFAVDSIPAVFAVTTDPFLVFTSNVFAILGLRSLYFALAAVMDRFRYLKFSLVFVLAFVGIKMILVHHHPIPASVSLFVIVTMLGLGVLASVLAGAKDTAPLVSPLEAELRHLAQISYRRARKVVVLVLGSSLLLFGAALLVLPGPGILVIMMALAALATEFVWARIWLARVKTELRELSEETKQILRGRSPRPTTRPASSESTEKGNDLEH